MLKLSKIIAVLMAGLVAFVPAAQANKITEEQMDMASLFLLADGYVQSHKDKVDMLIEGEEDSYTYDLKKGGKYRFVGVCDDDCEDLDLEVYDKNGRLVGIDYDNDDAPIVGVKAAYTGKYKLVVSLEHCSTILCDYRVRAFQSFDD